MVTKAVTKNSQKWTFPVFPFGASNNMKIVLTFYDSMNIGGIVFEL